MQRLLSAAFLTSATWLCALAPMAVAQTRCGVDELVASDFEALAGAKVGLITNHTGRTRNGERTVDVLHRATNVELIALFSPEHGWHGSADEKIGDTTDDATGLHVFSLYGKTRKPSAEMLADIDALVFDVQDIGCRFYTYGATMRNCMEAAAEHGKRFVVLDRPNPINGVQTAGPVLAAKRRDFVAAHTIPLRHGLTLGELARMIVGENGLQLELDIVKCTGWQRADRFDDTGLRWISPSPNMRRLTQALTYPGIGMIEGTNISVGRGTDTPFEIVGAPWCDGMQLAANLQARKLPGVTFVPVDFTPTSSRHRGKPCSGVHILVTDWHAFEAVRTGIHLACALRELHEADWQTKRLDWLLKHEKTYRAILDGDPADEIIQRWAKDAELFRMRRRPFLLYD